MESLKQTHPREYRMHKILAHSYTSYFVLFLLGVFLDVIFRFEIFTNSIWTSIGVILLIMASFLIFWAQKTSRNQKTENVRKETFLRGPYRYTRHPTHWGLFFLTLGFGIVANALFVVLFTLISFLVSRIFLQKREKILEEKHGTSYVEYKQSVKF